MLCDVHAIISTLEIIMQLENLCVVRLHVAKPISQILMYV